MNDLVIKEISNNLNISEERIKVVLNLLEEGNTIPFIARYRKEKTGALDEEAIRKIYEVYEYETSLFKRKEDVIRLIDEKGLLTEELKTQILSCTKLVEVEDLYRPYKEKKKTKATEAISKGLEGLAKYIMTFPTTGNIENIASKYVNDKVQTIEEAISGAKDIIAEWISDNASYRTYIRNNTFNNGLITSKKKKDADDENKIFEMYYEFSEKVKYIKPHRVLALNRGEKLKILNVNIEVDSSYILSYLEKKVIKNNNSFVCKYVLEAIEDAYKRLIKPSIEREIRSELTESASVVAIENFSKNLENLLLTPPMKEKIVLGFDPAFRTGCKLAVLDKNGNPLEIAVIYPHEPQKEVEKSKKIILDLVKKYNIDIIAIGNGTASRESELFIIDVIKESDKKLEYIIVNEAGASVYSASKLAIEEFPELTVEKRSAISIGRRLQDPLSELVKIDPESIGVGLYQHDMPQKKLSESLDFVVLKSVNSVGVNINTASFSLLKYISGLTKKYIEKIIDYRNKKGKITSREELKKNKLLTDKVYEQAIGFLRIMNGDNILDKTSIHPESYEVTLKLLKELNLNIKDIGKEEFISKLSNINIEDYSRKLCVDVYTLGDIISSLIKPSRDPRDDMPKPVLKSDVLDIKDLKKGMRLEGTVRNVVDFGAFIDIGLHNDGLVHISKISKEYIEHPSEVLNVGDIVECYVIDIFPEKEKVSLSLIAD